MSVTKRPKGLGRGLDALLGGETFTAPVPGGPQSLKLAQLQAGRYQPRTRMDEEALAELADSIRAQGIIQPILVRPIAADRYEIIAGERRFRAAALAGLSEVPVQVREVPDDAALALALIENIQREDLSPLEEAQGVQRLIDEFTFTHEQAAAAIGRSRSSTSNLLRLLNLAAPVQELLLAGRIDMGHARALLAVDAASQIQLAERISARQLTVRDAEALVRRQVAGEAEKPKAAKAPLNPDLRRLQEELSDALGTEVAIQTRGRAGKHGHQKGQVHIDFASLDQLQGLIDRLLQPR